MFALPRRTADGVHLAANWSLVRRLDADKEHPVFRVIVATFVCLLSAAPLAAEQTPQPSAAPQVKPTRPPNIRTVVPPVPKAPAPVERLGDNLIKVGELRVDTARKEVSVPGTINEVVTVEFIANTKGGIKSYESIIELETNALNFNVALLLIGLDKANAVLPTRHLDPTPPKGDPVEIFVEWEANGAKRRVPAEQLVFNQITKTTLPAGQWVYTGSTFNERANALLADLDGALIGFVHSPSLLIDHAGATIGPYGANRMNAELGLKVGTPVLLIVRAVQPARR